MTPTAAAKALGKLGASKGGKARWAALTPDQRRALSLKMTAAREAKWAQQGGGASSP